MWPSSVLSDLDVWIDWLFGVYRLIESYISVIYVWTRNLFTNVFKAKVIHAVKFDKILGIL